MAIELLDELVFGIREAAWPAIRRDLNLDYATIGVLLAVPGVVSGLLEPFIALLGNTGKRRILVSLGGMTFSAALLILASAGSFGILLLAFVLLYPASGAFVGLSQANLMDLEPASHERNMARWVLAGSVGVVIGPLAFALASRMGWGWRPLCVVLAMTTLHLTLRSRLRGHKTDVPIRTFRDSVRTAWRALRNREVIRWLALLQLTDLMGDVLTGFLALYFVDVVHVPLSDAAFVLVLWLMASLLGDALLVPLLDRASGLVYLRISALLAAFIYPGFLLVPGLAAKLFSLCMLGVLHAGWYAIPQGRLYSELPENSGVAVAVSNVAGLPAQAFPLILGVLAQSFGLQAALWCCLLAPIALLVGLPRS